jgi:hypothetical protein
MKKLTQEEIEEQRDRNYRRRAESAVRSEEAAKEFIDEVVFGFLFPVRGVELPNLWDAINGGPRPMPRHHHDYELGLTWRWKDSLPANKQVFYAKFLRQKPTLISLSMFPYFYSLSDNYGELDDYLDSYQDGRMSEEAKRIYEVLIDRGASTTGVLRREAGLWGQRNSSRFDRAVGELQRGLKIAKCGTSDTNRWKYCYVYDILLRWLPQEVERGLAISGIEAMQAIIAQYLKTVVVSTPEKVARLFDWPVERTGKVVDSMLADGSLLQVEVEGQEGGWIILGDCYGDPPAHVQE